MKRILSLTVSLMLVLTGFTAFSAESTHWAYNSVSVLVSAGIVSGNQNGELNLDNPITRAEFIKTVNRYFSLTEKAETGFSDVSEDSWYYPEMLIAKKAGYIKGDQNGSANPDLYITRAEVCVIIARLLKLEGKNAGSFSDASEIPSWAVDAVNALCERKIINGYSDGSFRAGNNITRAEAFVIVSRNERKLPVTYGNKEAEPSDVFIPVSGGSSAGGGGGGGGNSTGSESRKATLSSRFFDKEAKKIEFVSENASGYQIKFVKDNNEYIKALELAKEDGSYKYADISALCGEFVRKVIGEGGKNGFDADIYVRAKGKTGYADSSYIKFGTLFLELDIPDVTGAVVSYNQQTGAYDISWTETEGAEGYKVLIYSDSAMTELIAEYETEETSFSPDISSYEAGKSLFVSVVAKKDGYYGNPDGSCGRIVTGFGGGEGTEENPYLIYNKEQLLNIRLMNGKAFRLMADIEEDDAVTEPITDFGVEFTGSLDGNGKEINVNLSTQQTTSQTTEGFGLFHVINGATFKNIVLKGSVSGRGNVGGIAGRGTGKCTFENIINYATVTSTNGFCGGIIARMYDGETSGTVIRNCINRGEVKSFGEAGGIVGVSNASNVIKDCANYGLVHSTNTNDGAGGAGGIIASSYGSVFSSCNFGEIDANRGYAGGIAGKLTKPDFVFENCFNAGNVTGVTAVGAIVTSLSEENIPLIRNCYNVNKGLNIYGGKSVPSYVNCFTLNGKDNAEGISVKTPEALSKELISDAFTLFSENEDSETYNKTFRYPQLKSNLIPEDFVYEDSDFRLTILEISYDITDGKWYVTINPTFKGEVAEYVLSLSGADDTLINDFNNMNKYEISDIPAGKSEARVTAYDVNGDEIEVSELIEVDFTFSGGIGTDESPYLLTSAEQFVKAFENGSDADETKVYLLTGFDETPLELPSDFKPLGVNFKGKLIGGNYVDGEIEDIIQKINFNITTGNSQRFVDFSEFTSGSNVYKTQGIIFHQLEGATVKNISLHGSVNSPNTPSYFGILAGRAIGSTIENVHNYASIDGDQQRSTGGIVGSTGGSSVITNCSNHGNITIPHATTSRADVGGIVGNMTATVISYCYNYGNIRGRDNAGGIAGYSNCDITRCGNYGKISNTRETTYGYAGGISGRSNGGNISQCFNAGEITSVKYAGGIFAHIPAGKTSAVTNCFNIGKIQGTASQGLAIGINLGTATVSGFYDLANPTVNSVCGINSGTLNVTDSFGAGASSTGIDVEKITPEEIKGLTGSNNTFRDSSVWTMTEGYSYPNLVNNPYTGDDYVAE